MQQTLGDFLRALRANDVRVSPAESIDAHRAVAEVGYGDRALLKDALCVTLAKTADEVGRFDLCFDTFFARDDLGGGAPGEPAASESLADQVLAGDGAALAQAMETAGQAAGVGEIQLAAQRGLMSRRILDRMGLRALEGEINQLRLSAAPDDQARADRLAAGRASLFARANQFVDRQTQLYASQTGRRLRDQILSQQALTSIAQEDIRAMEALVRRMARRLATRYARKRRRARKGRLDTPKTLRKSFAHSGVPFEIVWKSKTLEKPKIVVICDVSRSVAAAAQFLLLLLYSLNEVVERLDAFAFSDHLVKVNDLLEDEGVDEAIALILARIGFRPTDYGQALEDFMAGHRASVDRHTTVIILGDGRSNYADPRLDLMRQISQQARAIVWLNPEPTTYWSQGDSKMDAYSRFCHVAKSCNSLGELERIIEDVLRAYLPK